MVRDVQRTERGWRFIAQVLESRQLTPSVHGIRVERPPEFEFGPVQFTRLDLQTPDGPDHRPMSIASSPTRPYIEYGARVSDSAWKQAFVALRPGDEVMVSGPAGHFLLDETRPAVFVAGGVGITPLKGMIEYATDRKLPIELRLLYSNRDETEIAYRGEIETLVKTNPRLKVTHTLTRQTGTWSGLQGRVETTMLDSVAKGIDRPAYYVCGAPGFVESVVTTLLGLGVQQDTIKFEQFFGY